VNNVRIEDFQNDNSDCDSFGEQTGCGPDRWTGRDTHDAPFSRNPPAVVTLICTKKRNSRQVEHKVYEVG